MMDKVTQGERDQYVKELLVQRDQDRKEKLKVLKEEKESISPNQTKIFEIAFHKQTKMILDKINFIQEKRLDETNLPEYLNCLKEDINSLNKYLTVSTEFLTSYSIKKGLETIETFENKLKSLETAFLPRKKFGFKAKKTIEVRNPAENDKDVLCTDRDEVDMFNIKINSLSLISCGVFDRKNENLKLCNDEIDNNDVVLRNLENCTIFLRGNPNTVHMCNITRCSIFIGPVSTSVFIENCSDSDIVVACQQLRIHCTHHTRFYVHITSRIVIEDTHDVQLAPYNLEYEDLETHFKNSGLCESPNNWNMVDDFNWLAGDMPSPNWNVINVEERVLNWTSLINF